MWDEMRRLGILTLDLALNRDKKTRDDLKNETRIRDQGPGLHL